MSDTLADTTSGLHVAGTPVSGEQGLHEVEKYLTVPPERQSGRDFDSADPGRIRALEDPRARRIVDAMKAAKSGHSYETLGDIADIVRVRLAALEAMTFFNSGRYDADYFNPATGLVPRMGTVAATRVSKYWRFLHPEDAWDAEFLQVPGFAASAAMAPAPGAIFPFRGECAGAFQMAIYLGLLNGLGPERFDDMAAKWGEMAIGPWYLGPDRTPNPAVRFMQTAPLDEPAIPGDYLYFKNEDDYLHWAPDGFWTGLNAMKMFDDDLGTPHYSGLGASWLSETNLRAALVNAYYHDCYPHVIADPAHDVRFTQRRILTIPASFETVMAQPRDTRAFAAPDAATLAAAGFAAGDGGHFHHAGIALADLGRALGFDPGDLRQVQSTGLDAPAHRVDLGGRPLIVEFAPGDHPGRQDVRVRAHIALPQTEG